MFTKNKDAFSPEISIIIPVYNTEKYISRCLDSILIQTFKNYEVLLINDGSTDGSDMLCREYASNYDFIKYYNQENQGLSVSRNYGVAEAKGEYITFIDSDDYIGENYLKDLYRLIKKYGSDISAVHIKKVFSSTNFTHEKKHNTICLTGKEALLDMLYQKHLDTSACAILIDKKIVRRNPFPVGRYHEDDFTTYKYYQEAKKVTISTKAQYFYYQRPGSIMHSQGRINYDELDAADNLVTVVGGIDDELKKAAESKRFSDYCQVLLTCPKMRQKDKDCYNRIVQYLKKIKYQIIVDSNTRIKNKVAAFSLVFGIRGLLLTAWISTKLLHRAK